MLLLRIFSVNHGLKKQINVTMKNCMCCHSPRAVWTSSGLFLGYLETAPLRADVGTRRHQALRHDGFRCPQTPPNVRSYMTQPLSPKHAFQTVLTGWTHLTRGPSATSQTRTERRSLRCLRPQHRGSVPKIKKGDSGGCGLRMREGQKDRLMERPLCKVPYAWNQCHVACQL